ncbi:HAD family hydrolase [Natronococcus occultus]|uniref:Haloacid dehalogenase superfamily enzyme, subfamily IA n=1 Tax=Natronococcus occultus SP4 TaxID=694430 RepID=L0JX89_9EURY|nr:HAD-IA family hydrolase [Natronococcus occultus]AGB36729.1 haloacid dehalogenase superfamily enzyme, subfamily IA [Natronococcus occultus SP4]
MTETILLDMDGVVLEGPGTPQSVYDRAADTAAAELGLEPTDRQRADLRAHGYETVESACCALGADPREFWRRKEAAASRLAADRIRSGERARYEDVAALESLAERATLALVSNNRHETVRFVADHLPVPFAAARGRDPTPEGFCRRKPDPHLLRETLDELGIEAGLYVGDRETDVLAAEEVGLEAAYLRRPHNADVPLPEDAAYEIESLGELGNVLEKR